MQACNGGRFPQVGGNRGRRDFLRGGLTAGVLLGLPACALLPAQQAPSVQKAATAAAATAAPAVSPFTAQEAATLRAVQSHLLPDDGDGPGAAAIGAWEYLCNALADAQNIEDGDAQALARGCGWLDDLARGSGDVFVKWPRAGQERLLRQVAASRAGEDWLSLLMFYLAGALMLDPVYGGNRDEAGWRWLQHQPGFPRPAPGHLYHDLLVLQPTQTWGGAA
jgi:gluconate 2-dehydrogenase gamma chain